MAYATQPEVQTYIGRAGLRQASDRDGNGVADATTCTQHIAMASDRIDSYLRAAPAGYDLPLATTPDSIKQICIVLTVYTLFWTDVTKDIRDQYISALSDLEKYSKGLLKLDDTFVSSEGGAAMDIVSNEPRWDRDNTESW